jgi:hypothetical protein
VGFAGWWLAADAKVDGEYLAHALLGDAELLAGIGEGLDPDRHDFTRTDFELYATGEYSLSRRAD